MSDGKKLSNKLFKSQIKLENIYTVTTCINEMSLTDKINNL